MWNAYKYTFKNNLLTCVSRPSMVTDLAAMAASAYFILENCTKPKPLERCVLRSLMTITSFTLPNLEYACQRKGAKNEIEEEGLHDAIKEKRRKGGILVEKPDRVYSGEY